MARTPISIAQGFYVDESIPIACQECVNFYPHIPTQKTISDASLIGCSGLDLATTAIGHHRGFHDMAGIPYCVNGGILYRIEFTEDVFGVRIYSAVAVSGDVIEGVDTVLMSDNGEQLCIVEPDYGDKFNCWIYTVSGGLVQVSDVDFDGPVIGLTFMDGYFVFLKADSNKFFISDLRDGTSYISTDFTSAESDPDNLVATAPLNGLLYVFGSLTCEQYTNQGQGSGFPFVRATSGVIQKGCHAPLSLIEFNGSLVWIGNGDNEKPSVWISSGDNPTKLSSAPIDNIINSGGIEKLRKAYVVKWAERGHSFLAFTVPDVCTMVFDSQSGLWHQRKSVNDYDQLVPWRVASLVYSYSEFIVGDVIGSNIGVMKETAYMEYDKEIHGYWTTPAIDNGGLPFSINSLELMMQTGEVPVSGQGSQPIMRMSISKDGGRIYSPEISRMIGATGDYVRRITWNLLGRYSRSAQFRFDISEPIKRVIVKGEIDIAG
jgi:hypothetical protein